MMDPQDTVESKIALGFHRSFLWIFIWIWCSFLWICMSLLNESFMYLSLLGDSYHMPLLTISWMIIYLLLR
jgi:hypothetical protein